MRKVVGTLVVVGLILSAGAARADNKAAARESFKEGTRRYDLNEFQSALEAFKRAYLQYEEPAFLFNIAQCHRQLGDKVEAVKFYKTYLRKVPSAPNRAETERLIATLETAIEQQEKSKPPTGTIDVPPPAPAPRPAPAPQPVVAKPPADHAAAGRTKKIAGLALLGGGAGLLALGAVFVGLAKVANDDVENPADGTHDPGAEDRRNTFQTLDAVFFAVGGAAVVTGLTLYLLGRRDATRVSIAPMFGPQRAGLDLTWRF
jgi:tetratricopeptide (TPR) repeat protein